MQAVIINGSYRRDNTTLVTSKAVLAVAESAGWKAELVTLAAFPHLFDGDFVTLETANAAQKRLLEAMITADTLVFVVPTYYKSMPGALKNFFDIVRCPKVYAGKRIAVVASNHKNQDYGARHAKQVLEGLLIFFSINAVIVPEILIQHHEALQPAEIDRFLSDIATYPTATD